MGGTNASEHTPASGGLMVLIFSSYQLLNNGDKAKEATKILQFDVFDNEGHNL